MMRLLRILALAIALALLVGFAIGTLIRMRLEQPIRYLSGAPARAAWLGRDATRLCLEPELPGALGGGSALPAQPFDVGHAGAPILHARQDKQQIG